MREAETPLTFLFTDIVGSTGLWQRHGEAMAVALAEHDERIIGAVERHGGDVFAGGGDGFGTVFLDPAAAIDAARAAQEALTGLGVGTDALAVRMGIHTGTAQSRGGDYFGLAVNRSARLCSAANGGQILASGVSIGLLESREGTIRLGEFRLADLLEPLTVYQVGDHSFPPIRALDPTSNNLPLRFTSLVGREGFVDGVVDELAANRLVTLVGPGGVGKTTVALEVGAEFASEQSTGVWLVRLDEVEREGEVVGQIVETVGLDRSREWAREASRRDMVLILDNAEHLLDGVADVVTQLLSSGPSARVLVTSREPLAVPGERIVEVPPLPVVGAATTLFLERAGLGETDDPAVASIVPLTDGVPLAIELVAGHAQRMSLVELAASLADDGLGRLVIRGTSQRHRSATSVVEWSYRLLDRDEQEALAAVSLFSGEFSLDQAAAVADRSRAVLQSLVDKSLIQPSDRTYRMLAITRAFAASALSESGREQIARRRLALLLAEEVEEIAEQVGPRNGEVWIDRLSLPVSDLLSSIGFAVETSDLELLERLGLALPGAFGFRRDLMRELFAIFDPIVSDLLSDIARWRWLLFRYAWCEDLVDREPQARELASRLRSVAVEVGDDELVGMSDMLTVRTGANYGHFSDEEIERLLSSAESNSAGSEWLEPLDVTFQRAAHADATGDLARAERLFRELLDAEDVSFYNSAITSLRLATVLVDQGRAPEAVEILEAITDELRSTLDWNVPRAHAHIAVGETDEALELLIELLDRDSSDPSVVLCPAADYFRAIGEHRSAVWVLAHMLGDNDPFGAVHYSVIAAGREALGVEFDREWRRGREMKLESLLGLLREA